MKGSMTARFERPLEASGAGAVSVSAGEPLANTIERRRSGDKQGRNRRASAALLSPRLEPRTWFCNRL